MAKILCEKRVLEYSKEFKSKVVELTDGLDVNATEIASILDLHPMMVYRWRQEYREGKLDYEPTRRISMTKRTDNPPITDAQKADLKELKSLRKNAVRMEKEIDFLKKWRTHLAEQKPKDSHI